MSLTSPTSTPHVASATDRSKATGSSADAFFGGHPRALVESSLERVLASTVFRRSERHRRFLRHVVRTTLDGKPELLKEVLLGIELFDRKIDRYDPRSDPIVRVEVGRIRDKLMRYYEGAGADDTLGFEIPVGAYVPRFGQRRGTTPSTRLVDTFAVMPLSTSGNDDDVGFVIALADQLINALARNRDVKVIARTSMLEARERRLDLKDIGRQLMVTHLIDGSFHRQGEHLRCVVHLYGVKEEIQLWSQQFESKRLGATTELPDEFAFQDLIVDAVIAAAVPQAGVARPPTAPRAGAGLRSRTASHSMTREAQGLYQRAAYLHRRFRSADSDDVIDLTEQALKVDPGNAQIHAALAKAHFLQVTQNRAWGHVARPRIERALEDALRIDPFEPEALALRAMIAFRFAFDWTESERLFREALQIAPHSWDINYRYAFCLVSNGRFAEGLQYARVAVELDPLNIATLASRAFFLAHAGELSQAEAQCRDVLQLEPDHVFANICLGLIHLYQQRPDDAIDRFDSTIARAPDAHFARFARIAALGLRGDVEDGTRDLQDLRQRLAGRFYPRYGLAIALLGLNDLDGCYAALDDAARDGDTTFCSVMVDPLFHPCHPDPRFLSLLQSHGLRLPHHWG